MATAPSALESLANGPDPQAQPQGSALEALANSPDTQQAPTDIAHQPASVSGVLQTLTSKEGLKATVDPLIGFVKGMGDTVHGTGELIRKVGNYGSRNSSNPGEGDRLIPPVGQAALNKMSTDQPGNYAQHTGKALENVAEFLTGEGAVDEAGKALSLGDKLKTLGSVGSFLEKHPFVAKMLASSGKGALVSGAQTTAKTGSPTEGAEAAGVGAVLNPAVDAVGAGVGKIRDLYRPLTDVSKGTTDVSTVQPVIQKGIKEVLTGVAKDAGVGDETAVGKVVSNSKPIYQMSPGELDTAHTAAKNEDASMLSELFGESGAKKYNSLQRIANGSNHEAADRASDELGRMEATLSPEQEAKLYGKGQTGPSHEDFADYKKALNSIDGDTPQELGSSMKYAVTKMGDIKDPALMNSAQQEAYAQLRHGFDLADQRGWNKNDVLQSALTGASKRFSDPADAQFMLQQFLKPKTAALSGTVQAAPKATSYTPPASIRDVVSDVADKIKGKSQPVFQKLDELSGGKLSDAQAEAKRYSNTIDKAGKDAHAAALKKQDDLFEKYKDKFSPDAFKQAKADWTQYRALQQVNDALGASTLGQRPNIAAASAGKQPAETVNPKMLLKRLNALYDDGTLQTALGPKGAHDLLQHAGGAQSMTESILDANKTTRSVNRQANDLQKSRRSNVTRAGLGAAGALGVGALAGIGYHASKGLSGK